MKTANLKINKARYEQLFESYRKADLTAVKEVNDSLCLIKNDQKSFQNNTQKFKEESDTYLRNKARFSQGVISYPDLLLKKENLLITEDLLINSKASLFVNYLNLYKSTGGKL